MAQKKYLVESIQKDFCQVRKITRNHFRSKAYDVRVSDSCPVIGDLGTQQNYAHNSSEFISEDDYTVEPISLPPVWSNKHPSTQPSEMDYPPAPEDLLNNTNAQPQDIPLLPPIPADIVEPLSPQPTEGVQNSS